MKHLKVGLFFAVCCAISAQAENKDIKVYGQNDEMLGEVKNVTDVKFADNQIMLVTANGEINYNRDNVKYFTLSNLGTSTSVDVMEMDSPFIMIESDKVVVNGISGGNALIQIVNPAGCIIGQINAVETSSVTVPLNGYKGMLIVNIKGEKISKSYKFISK